MASLPQLPVEIFTIFASRLPPRDLSSLSEASSATRAACTEALFEDACMAFGLGRTQMEDSPSWRQVFKTCVKHAETCQEPTCSDGAIWEERLRPLYIYDEEEIANIFAKRDDIDRSNMEMNNKLANNPGNIRYRPRLHPKLPSLHSYLEALGHVRIFDFSAGYFSSSPGHVDCLKPDGCPLRPNFEGYRPCQAKLVDHPTLLHALATSPAVESLAICLTFHGESVIKTWAVNPAGVTIGDVRTELANWMGSYIEDDDLSGWVSKPSKPLRAPSLQKKRKRSRERDSSTTPSPMIGYELVDCGNKKENHRSGGFWAGKIQRREDDLCLSLCCKLEPWRFKF